MKLRKLIALLAALVMLAGMLPMTLSVGAVENENLLKEAKEGIDYEEIVEYVPADHTYGIVGGFAASGWGSDGDDIAMEADGENTWTGEVELAAGDEFKVRADSDWTYSWGEGEGNLTVDADGTYVVTIKFDGETPTITVDPKE